jgi:tetratricopeptide (TPR) repeat protein
MEGPKDLAAAAAHFQEAVTISAPLTDRTHLFNALSYMAQVQLVTGDMVGAADMLNRAISLGPEVKDQSLLLFVHLDRADVFEKLAEKSAATKAFAPQLENLKLAQADYETALGIARKFGYTGISPKIEQFLRHLTIRRGMAEKNTAH